VAIKSIQAKLNSVNQFSGGRAIPANIVGGVLLVSGTKTYEEVFTVPYNSTQAHAKLLSNQMEAGKIGSKESMDVLAYGVHFQKITAGKATEADLNLLVQIMMSTRLEVFTGNGDTRILDVNLSRFMGIINTFSGPTTPGDGVGVSLPVNTSRWLLIPHYIGGREELGPNTNYKGKLSCGLASGTPAVTADTWILNVIFDGVKFMET
jgi:hypothetical protein